MIQVTCACGNILVANPDRAGQRCRCPSCGAELVLPGAPLTPDAPGVRELAPPAPPKAGAARTSCPSCGAKLAPAAIVCVACGMDLSSGERLTGGARGLLSVEERLAHREERDRVGLLRLVLGALFTPVSTLETIRYQLSFPRTLLGMVGFWLATLVAVGALGALAAQQVDHAAEPVHATPRVANHVVKLERPGTRVILTPWPFVAGRGATCTFVVDGEPVPGEHLAALVPYGALPRPGDERALAPGRALDLAVPDLPRLQLLVRHRAVGIDALVLQLPVETMPPPPPKPTGRLVALGALLRVSVAIASLLVWTALFAIGARMIAGRADLLPLLASLAFLQGVTNLAWIPLLPFYAQLGTGVLLVDYSIRFWTLALYFLLLAHLYDLDARSASLLVLFAGGVIYVGLYFATKGKLGMP